MRGIVSDHLLEEQLIDFTLGNLDVSQLINVREHLTQCLQCRVELESWHELLMTGTSLEPSDQLKERLIAELDQAEETELKTNKRWHRKRFGMGLVMALTIFLSFISYGEFKSEQPFYEMAQHNEVIPSDFYEQVTMNSFGTIPVQKMTHVPNKQWVNSNIERVFPEESSQITTLSEGNRMWIFDGENIWIGELKDHLDDNGEIYNLDRLINDFKWLKVKFDQKTERPFQSRIETLYIDIKAN